MNRRSKRPSKYQHTFWEALPQSTNRPIGEILADIDDLTKEAFFATDKPHELQVKSKAVDNMPAYMKGLGYYLADAENEVTIAKDDYEFQKAKQETGLITAVPNPDNKPLSVAVAERMVAIDDGIVLLKEKYRKAQHNYRVLKLQYDASNRQFEGWRSRLSVLKNEEKQGA